MKTGAWIAIGVVALFALPIVGIGLNTWFGTWRVVGDELDPKVVQQKYEEFKEMSGKLDAKVAGIQVLEGNIKAMEESYNGTSRQNWTRDDARQHSQWKSEVAGLKLSYNNLAAEYNSNMAKWNYRFANAGSMPECVYEDGTPCQPLRREYRTYIIE